MFVTGLQHRFRRKRRDRVRGTKAKVSFILEFYTSTVQFPASLAF